MDETSGSAVSTTTRQRQRLDKESRDRLAGRKRAERILAELENKSGAFRAAFRRCVRAGKGSANWQMPKSECPDCGLLVSRSNLSRHVQACQARHATQELCPIRDYCVDKIVCVPRIDEYGEKPIAKVFLGLRVTLHDGRLVQGFRWVRIVLRKPPKARCCLPFAGKPHVQGLNIALSGCG